jgi:hypothetical protein
MRETHRARAAAIVTADPAVALRPGGA